MDLKSITNSEPPPEHEYSAELPPRDEDEALHPVLPSDITEDENLDSEAITNNAQSPFLDVPATRDDANESDSTVSESAAPEGQANPKDVDLVDIDLGLEDDSIEEFNCHWQGCDANFDNSKQLTHHTADFHVKDHSNLQCQWDGCLERFSNRIALISHIRRHSRENPYFCPLVSCPETFNTSKDLIDHLQKSHNNQLAEKVPWYNYLNELLDHNITIEKDPLRATKTAKKRYKRIHTAADFEDSITRARIDFLKVQNIQVGDIVAEPSKKKGRTANSEINVEIRNDFKESNDAYKQLLVDSSKNAFEELEGIEILPGDNAIDSRDKAGLIQLYESLNRKFLWALEVEQLLKKDLEWTKETEEKLWLSKEALLEASIQLEIPKDEQVYELDNQ